MPGGGINSERTADPGRPLIRDSPRAQSPRASSGRRWRLIPAALLPVALFLWYLRVSQTYPSDSYGGVTTQQAWDMLHGNPLLHGWSMSDISVYTTEVPEYLLVTLVRGLGPDVVHIAAAITFTLLIVLAALLAKGRARGREAVAAVLITAGVIGSPQLGTGIYLLLEAPDHLGTSAAILLAWLILDRWQPRWYVPVAVGAVLAWTLVADPIATVTAVIPLLVVCGIRLVHGVVRLRQPWRSRWFEASLIVAGLAAVAVARGALALIKAMGGFYVHPVRLTLISLGALPHHLLLAGKGILILFGADLFGRQPALTTALALLHLVGLALAAWAMAVVVRRAGRGIGLVPQILAVAVLVNLAAFLLWGSLRTDLTVVREIVAVLPFSAVLAGRLLAGPLVSGLRSGRVTAAGVAVPVLAAVLAGYLVSLGLVAAHPVRLMQYQRLTSWLTVHHFRYGIGWGPLTGEVSVASHGRVTLVPVVPAGGGVAPGQWEADASWFDPRQHDATFLAAWGPQGRGLAAAARSMFGLPARTYRFGDYTVLTWERNLLVRMRH